MKEKKNFRGETHTLKKKWKKNPSIIIALGDFYLGFLIKVTGYNSKFVFIQWSDPWSLKQVLSLPRSDLSSLSVRSNAWSHFQSWRFCSGALNTPGGIRKDRDGVPNTQMALQWPSYLAGTKKGRVSKSKSLKAYNQPRTLPLLGAKYVC